MEQDRTVKAIQYAIQMEIDGKDYYLKASRESNNELGKKLLQSLADEEDIHRRKFEEIYMSIQENKSWPVTDFQPDGGKGLRTVFSRAIGEIGKDLKSDSAEIDAAKKAVDMESKTYDFYNSQSAQAVYDTEREFYDTLATEEREHHLIMLDYYEYLKDPAAWFVKSEKPSLDGS